MVSLALGVLVLAAVPLHAACGLIRASWVVAMALLSYRLGPPGRTSPVS
jgi:hypothetical protein